MRPTSLHRILSGATALGASIALLGAGLAGAAPSSTMSSDSGGSLDSSSSSTSPGSTESQASYEFTGWDYCPFDDILNFNDDGSAKPGPQSCMTFLVKGGSFTIGDLNVELDPNSMMIAGGQDLGEMTADPTTSWRPLEGSIHAAPVTVPGGAFGTGSAEVFGPTKITAHVIEAGTPVVDTANVDPETGYLAPHISLPIQLKLSNALLGDNCYIGTKDDPITLDMIADSATMGNMENPIVENGQQYTGLVYRGVEASGDDFAVPAATGCGILGLGELNWAVNLRAGLPSAIGNNSIHVTTDYYAGPGFQIYNQNR